MSAEKYQLILIRDDVGYEEEQNEFFNWTKNVSYISFDGENKGCGCCVDIFEFECPEAALLMAPDIIRSKIDRVMN